MLTIFFYDHTFYLMNVDKKQQFWTTHVNVGCAQLIVTQLVGLYSKIAPECTRKKPNFLDFSFCLFLMLFSADYYHKNVNPEGCQTSVLKPHEKLTPKPCILKRDCNLFKMTAKYLSCLQTLHPFNLYVRTFNTFSAGKKQKNLCSIFQIVKAPVRSSQYTKRICGTTFSLQISNKLALDTFL